MCVTPKRAKDITGQRFGKLTVLAFHGLSEGKSQIAKWLCQCDCGNTTVAFVTVLNSGRKTTCGCEKGQRISERIAKHGQHGTPTYLSWRSMKARCLNPSSPDYADYGGRGITVCDRWASSFEAFLADMGERPTGLTLDRVDTNGNYEPGNCQWSTPKKQASNRRNNSLITYKGEEMTISEFAERVGLTRQSARYYLKVRGMAPEEVASTVQGALVE